MGIAYIIVIAIPRPGNSLGIIIFSNERKLWSGLHTAYIYFYVHQIAINISLHKQNNSKKCNHRELML
jgi:hypothetical protein